jgi:hypothetical protein
VANGGGESGVVVGLGEQAVGPAEPMDRMRFPWRVEVQRSAGIRETGWSEVIGGRWTGS